MDTGLVGFYPGIKPCESVLIRVLYEFRHWRAWQAAHGCYGKSKQVF